MKSDFATDHLRKRVISFVMAVLLALTPVLSDIGGTGGVKADDARVKTLLSDTINVSEGTAEDRTVTNVSYVFDNTKQDILYRPSASVTLYYTTVNSADAASKNIPKTDESSNSGLTEYSSYGIAVDGTTVIALYTLYTPENQNPSDSESTTQAEVTTEAGTTTQAGTSEAADGVDDANSSVYLLQKTVTFTACSSLKEATFNGYKSNAAGATLDALSDDDAVLLTAEKTITGNVAAGEAPSDSLGALKYIAKQTSNTNLTTEQLKNEDGWNNTLDGALATIQGLSTGIDYVVYAGYYGEHVLSGDAPGSDSGEQLIDSKKLIKLTVYTDTAEPVISNLKLSVQSGGKTEEVTADNTIAGSYYMQDTETAVITADVTDDNLGTVKLQAYKNGTDLLGDSVDMSASADSSTYTGEFSTSSVSSNLESTDFVVFKVIATDKFGNEKTSDATSYSIKKYDINKSDITVAWTDGTKPSSDTPLHANSAKTLKVDVVCAAKPVKVAVKYNINNAADKTSTEKTVTAGDIQTINGYNSFSKTFELPVEDENEILTGLEVYVYGDSNTQIASYTTDLGSLYYDGTSPDISYSKSYSEDSEEDGTTNYLYSSEQKPVSPHWVNAASTLVTVNKDNKTVTFDGVTVKSGASTAYESDMDTVVIEGNENVSFEKDEANSANTTIKGSIVFKEVTPQSGDSYDGISYELKATDKAGNSTIDPSVVYIDLTAPSLTSIVVKNAASKEKYIVYPDTGDRTIYATKDSTVTLEASDSISGLSTLAYYVQVEGKYVLKNTISEELGSSVKTKLSAILKDMEDGTYTIKAELTDKAGNVTEQTFTLNYDNAAPEIKSIELVTSDDDGVTWNKVSSGNIYTDEDGNKIYYINNTEKSTQKDTNKYAYKVVIKDADIDTSLTSAGFPKALDVAYTDYDMLAGTGTISPDGSGTYTAYIDIDTSKLKSSAASGITVKATDKTGLTTENAKESGVYVCGVSNKLVINNVKLYAAGKEVDVKEYDSYAKGTNKSLSIEARVEGPAKITKVSLVYKDGTEVIGTIESFEDKDYDASVLSTTKRYRTKVTFDLPTDSNVNFKDLKLMAWDEDHENATEKTITALLYDKTNPVATYTATAEEKVWVSEASFDLGFSSGNGDAESNLESASYTIAGDDTDITPKDKTSVSVKGVKIAESKTIAGTKVVIKAADEAGNYFNKSANGKTYTYYVDSTNPVIKNLTVDNNEVNTIALTGNPTVRVSVEDNLTLKQVKIEVTYPDGTTVKGKTVNYGSGKGNIQGQTLDYSYTLEALKGSYAPDGDYKVVVTAYDKAGNAATKATTTFRIDNTKPALTAAISGGTPGGKQTREDGTDYYYSTDVPVSFTIVEDNFTTELVTVTDKAGNGEAETIAVNWTKSGEQYVGSFTASSEGRHIITINASDPSGNIADTKSVEFCIDKTAPTLSFILNGLAYTESRGLVYLTADAQLTAAVSDMTDDAGDFNIQIIQKKPDQAATTPEYLKTGNRTFTFSEEGDYTINVYSVDMANNKSAVRTITFRVDKTAPELNITGVTGGGTSANASTVTFTMNEAFWQDATASVNIYRKAGDGKEESLYKTLTLTPTAYSSSVSESLTETGVYRFEFTASDQAGHKTETSQSYTIDREAPVVTLSGVNNYDITDENVQFAAQITDDFYSSKKVSLNGYVTDINGKKTSIDFGAYNQSGNPTVINQEFASDGIYDIEVTSSDTAGNSQTGKVHFTIDKTAPEIGDLSAYEGTLKEFKWDIDLDELVSDLTVCETHMYLNGSEYDGVSDIEDGSYVLLITAEDEMGHTSEKEVSFVLDTKAPVFIVTGVEDGEVKNETYSIGVSLQLSEDSLEEVTLNGTAVDIVDNAAEITVDSKGDYTLTMSATDEAGNKASQEISFTYGEKTSNWWIWLVIVAGLLVLGFVIVVVVKKNNEENQA